MDKNQILDDLKPIFDEVFPEEEFTLSMETTTDDIGPWDSMAHVQIIVAIEEKYGIQFDPEEIVGFTDLGDLIDTIIRRRDG